MMTRDDKEVMRTKCSEITEGAGIKLDKPQNGDVSKVTHNGLAENTGRCAKDKVRTVDPPI